MSDVSTVREILEKSTTVLNENWVSGDWFLMDYPEGIHEDDWGIPVNDDGEQVDATQNVMVGVCLAGGVLYSLGYTNETYIDQDNVRPVIELIYEALGKKFSRIAEEGDDMHDIPGYTDWCATNRYIDMGADWKQIYDSKVSTIVNWNDAVSRQKAEVIDVLQQATKFAIDRGL